MGLCGAFFLIQYILTHITQKFIEFHNGELFVQCENNNAVTTAFGIQSSISGGRKRTVGAGEIKCVPGTIRQHIRIGYIFVLPLVILFALFPNLILSIYTDIPDLREASIPSLWVLCSAYLILVPANVYFQAVSGTGNTRTALGLELCVLAIYLIYITYMILYLRVDVAVCWTTEHLYGICILFLSYLYIKKGNWQKKQI